MDSGEKENVRKSLEFVIVGAPEEEGGVPDTDDPSSPSSSASPKSPRAPPTKRARLYRVFEYDEAHIESERAAAERVLSKMKKRKKNARPNRKSAGKPAETLQESPLKRATQSPSCTKVWRRLIMRKKNT
jgi:hypothetical protein